MTNRAHVGLFLIGAMGLFLAGIFIIGEHQQLLTHNDRLRAPFADVAGLLPGAEVRVGGLRKGRVEEIRLPSNPRDKVLVTVALDHSALSLVKADSQAAIETEGLLGNKFVSISFGSAGAAALQDGATLATAQPLDATDLIRKTNEILDLTKDTMKNLNVALTNLATVTDRINRGEGSVGALLNERTLYDRLVATTDQAQQTVVLAKASVLDFQDNMKALKGNFLLRGFFKERGYLDSSELTRWELPALPASPARKAFQFLAEDLFAKADSAQLKGQMRLEPVGVCLQQAPFDRVVVQAFSGPGGNPDASLLLTQGQAMVVRSYLAEHFHLDGAKLKTMGMGEVATGIQGSGHWLEILIY